MVKILKATKQGFIINLRCLHSNRTNTEYDLRIHILIEAPDEDIANYEELKNAEFAEFLKLVNADKMTVEITGYEDDELLIGYALTKDGEKCNVSLWPDIGDWAESPEDADYMNTWVQDEFMEVYIAFVKTM